MSDNTLFMPSLEIFSIIRSQKGVDYILVANIVISRQQAKTSGKQFGIWQPPPLQKKARHKGRAEFRCVITDYPSEIAPAGQFSAQVPQLMQTSGLITKISPSEIASTGQPALQVPHATQFSSIT